MLKKLLILLIVLASIAQLPTTAIPAYPGIVNIVQPDGTELSIRVIGDEFFRYRTTSDGYHIAQYSDGFYYYYQDGMHSSATTRSSLGLVRANNPSSRTAEERAFLSTQQTGPNAQYLSLGVQAARVKRQMQNQQISQTRGQTASSHVPVCRCSECVKTTPVLALQRLVILAEFQDVRFNSAHTTATFESMLNDEGYSFNGATGSARDYYYENSLGRYDPTFVVTRIVTLPQKMAYYGANDNSGNDILPAQMVLDACLLLDSEIDFSQFDANNDGYIDDVFVFYAGHNEAEGADEDTIWPHKWAVYDGNSSGNRTFDGKTLYGYACTSELRGVSGATLSGIGTMTHEFGHVLGLPDYYDTDYDTNGYTVGLYQMSLMSSGGYNNNGNTPPYLNGYERYQLGWAELKFVDKTSTTEQITLSTINTEEGNDPWAIKTSKNGEYFLVEARTTTGWDAPLGSNTTGMMIYHIDSSSTQALKWNTNAPNAYLEHPCFKIVESTATTYQNYYPTLRQLVYPGRNNKTTFETGSYGFGDWNGELLSYSIANIAVQNETVTLNFQTLQGLFITPLQYSAMIKYIDDETENWNLRYRVWGTTEWTTVENITQQTHLIENLSAKTQYELEAYTTQKVTNQRFTTVVPTSGYPRIGGIDSGFSYGSQYVPYLENLQEAPVSVVWSFEGKVFETLTVGYSGDVVCVIKYQDGATETIKRKIEVI